ncbi:MAG: glycosyltransferase [Clostridiales bacterium]|nr:glycosyltransferase [Clostridiales bacterium]
MPKLSIIIPVYNASAYLEQALDSVLNQSLKDIEVICVDDGSTDSSPDILRRYAKKDSRVRLLHQDNLHAGVARNAGLAVATGEYVHFLDADDYVLDHAYEALYTRAVKYDLDLLKCSTVVWDVQQDTAVDRPSFTLSRMEVGSFHRLLNLDEGSPIYKVNVAPWNGLYRRAFLEAHALRFSDLFCVNDRSFFAAVITNADRMMLARDRLVVHRINLENSLVGLRSRHFDCHFRSIRIVEERLARDNVSPDVTERIMVKEFTDLFNWFQDFGQDDEIGQQIVDATRDFVHSYQGACACQLKTLYASRSHTLNGPARRKASPKTVQLFHSAVKSPKVSVVLPIYNVEDYLTEALYSLSQQTLDEMEFLCVNDGSTDSSMAIIREFADVDKRFRVLDGPNGGYGKAMNRGIDAAKGAYLGILEPDDFVPPDMYASLYKTASENQLDFVKADFYRFMVNPDGSLRQDLNRLTHARGYYGRVICPGDEIETFKFVMNTWSGIYSLDFLNRWHIRHNETPGASYQDNGFWFQTFCRAERAWFVNKPFYMNRRDNPNSSMFNRKKLYCVTDEYRYIWDWMSKDPALVEKFTPIFYAKKFSNFMVTYRRLAPEYQLEYLHHICDEFRPAIEQGLLDEELLGPAYWKQIHEILADPDAYHAQIRVSVIIPVYNAEPYLRQTLDSLLVRNETQFEVICVDDGSTDGSLDILREYEAKDARVRVVTQANAGAGAARNNGMQYARGEYLSFLDADDFFELDMLRLAYDRAHTLETDITVFRCDQYYEATGEYAPARYTINEALLPAHQPFAGEEILQDTFKAFVGWAWDKLFRADFVRENGLKFQEQRTSNDMLFVFSAVVRAKRISTMNKVLAHHRRDAGSLSVTREKSWDCFYHALCALRQQLKDWNVYDRLEQDFVNYSQHFALWNVTTLRGPSYHKLYDKLSTEWAADLGLTSHEAPYFYSRGEYRKMQALLSSTSEEFLFQELDGAKLELTSLRAENALLKESVQSLTRRCNRQETRIERLKTRNSNLKAQSSKLKAKNREMKRSTIWKVGRILTWPFRKLKKLLKRK